MSHTWKMIGVCVLAVFMAFSPSLIRAEEVEPTSDPWEWIIPNPDNTLPPLPETPEPQIEIPMEGTVLRGGVGRSQDTSSIIDGDLIVQDVTATGNMYCINTNSSNTTLFTFWYSPYAVGSSAPYTEAVPYTNAVSNGKVKLADFANMVHPFEGLNRSNSEYRYGYGYYRLYFLYDLTSQPLEYGSVFQWSITWSSLTAVYNGEKVFRSIPCYIDVSVTYNNGLRDDYYYPVSNTEIQNGYTLLVPSQLKEQRIRYISVKLLLGVANSSDFTDPLEWGLPLYFNADLPTVRYCTYVNNSWMYDTEYYVDKVLSGVNLVFSNLLLPTSGTFQNWIAARLETTASDSIIYPWELLLRILGYFVDHADDDNIPPTLTIPRLQISLHDTSGPGLERVYTYFNGYTFDFSTVNIRIGTTTLFSLVKIVTSIFLTGGFIMLMWGLMRKWYHMHFSVVNNNEVKE